ncbi:hypothetical protein [Encephalitozoon cuniculi GB-M1]|uniref:Uncharacterized protein n=2 Tax=Encephalitozoon cuniculi TaxID=6035 RepID=Q8SV99_ENCCU|nr:uncharacterized protein ECU06_1050 [Encephalitozoon cuniculi GB-M1]AGE95772.1 hypothetical protein ECU06_1050 [Encephalitozoon cuniculi]KMV65999.1 hypothetical protein M970_060990 [Encephalitozoon cuniculi EcunIII-L]UYI27697.1 hypothetical protein J0A71_07g15770 [Encephalitozoon cuniculi]CAD25465.1 hypothetical protein [Encephalitozoon cuniculi GB-M1]
MEYDLPFLCPIFSPRYCLASTLCPCYLSSIVYARIFKNKRFSAFGFFLVPFSVYGIRRYVQDKLQYKESFETSAIKSLCCCNSLTQDLHEMKIRRIGVYKFLEEPVPCDDSDQTF